MDQHTLAVRAQSHVKIPGTLLEPTIDALRAINAPGPTFAEQREREEQILSDARGQHPAAIDDRLAASHGPNER